MNTRGNIPVSDAPHVTGAAFVYDDGVLKAEDVALTTLAEDVGTPFYCYSSIAMNRQFQTFSAAVNSALSPAPLVCFAVKSNSNQAVLETLAAQGAGADVVSGGELVRALAAGIRPEKIVFSGVGKTEAEMEAALESGINQINVESVEELVMLDGVATRLNHRAPVGLRVNPDVDAGTHEKISTGKAENKFGIDLPHAADVYARAAEMDGIELCGLAVHIGSQLTDLAPFREAFARLAGLVGELRGQGHQVHRLDLGGGLGISYDGAAPPDLDGYAAILADEIAPLECETIFEPGRFVIGNAGVLVTRIVRIKQGMNRRFVIIDAAMNDLLRPALYDAHHHILSVIEPAGDAVLKDVDVVGPVCETGDTFAEARPLAPLETGDLLAICSAGAYGAVMASDYNTRPPAAEILVAGGDYAVIRPRLDVKEIIARDRSPSWLSASGGSGKGPVKR
ncbi:MAG: diaminopimelate decarboxylase [Rhodospirillaceae bacterium]|jgi:diaminopimelate decarboxylase|nr:diaminopimelate decarboxylase [Rhodospirillaceae bacterium]MBT5752273.1 diaminopimelate decarboxylase [Rhodospirillaceae bacterium]